MTRTIVHVGRKIRVAVDEEALPDGRVNPKYDSGDGIHLNDAGHRLLAQKVAESSLLREWLGVSRIRAWWDGVLAKIVRVL